MSASSAVRAWEPQRIVPQILGSGTAIVIIICGLLWAAFAVRQPRALSDESITEIFNNSLPLALAAAGGTLVMLTRGFDLSVAGVVALSNVVMATQIGAGPSGALEGLGIVAGIGLVIGATNGVLVAYVRLQSIASTLSTMIVCSGLALLVLNAPGGQVPDFVAYQLTGNIGPVPVTAIIAGVILLIWAALRRTDWGVALYAIGADETAARLAGISANRVKFLAYCLAGICYGLAGYMLSALTGTGDPNSGTSYLLLMFAAIAIGGTSFAGGRGGVLGSMVGALTLMLLQKVLFAAGVSSFYTGIFQGLVMIAAVLVGAFSASFAEGRGR